MFSFRKTAVELPPAPAYLRSKKSDHSRCDAPNRRGRASARDVRGYPVADRPAASTTRTDMTGDWVGCALADVSLRVVTVNHDTSVAMLERAFSRYIGGHAHALARIALLDTTAMRTEMLCL
jgi:hypothetical protein